MSIVLPSHSLPLAASVSPRVSRNGRLFALAVSVAAAALLSVAAWLDPSPAGLGTHEQLKLPTCGWISLADVPCPTCGMTTAFAHAADGDLVSSFLAQPLGFLLALATAMTLIVGVYVAATGARVVSMLGRLWGRRSGWLIAGVFVAAWGYKVMSHRGYL